MSARAFARRTFSTAWAHSLCCAWLLGEGDRHSKVSIFTPDSPTNSRNVTSRVAARFSVARYDRRMFARRHSRIRRSQREARLWSDLGKHPGAAALQKGVLNEIRGTELGL